MQATKKKETYERNMDGWRGGRARSKGREKRARATTRRRAVRARNPLLAGVKSEMTTRTSRVVDSDNRVPVQAGYDTVNSARFVAERFSQEGGRQRRAREFERARENEGGREKESAREEERERSVVGVGGRGRNSLCYRLKFFTGKILIVAFY